MRRISLNLGIALALASAMLFGLTTPLAKTLLDVFPPVALAGVFYLGAGLGLLGWRGVRRVLGPGAVSSETGLNRSDAPWLIGAIACGGVAAPWLLMWGLRTTPATNASLLLNLESALTAVVAWALFDEHYDRRLAFGMTLIVLAGAVLTAQQLPPDGWPMGSLAIVAACLCWALDNNLTRRISGSDPVQIAGIKGLVAGTTGVGIALLTGWDPPRAGMLVVAAIVGLLGYGVSLTLFIRALRYIGSARTAAYFSAAPFIGALTALWIFGEHPGIAFWFAMLLMAAGMWLHLSERHGHRHTHEPLAHAHAHVHDEHHRHEHDFPWDGREPHAHFHRHAPLVHAHPHYPDLHHRHKHG